MPYLHEIKPLAKNTIYRLGQRWYQSRLSQAPVIRVLISLIRVEPAARSLQTMFPPSSSGCLGHINEGQHSNSNVLPLMTPHFPCLLHACLAWEVSQNLGSVLLDLSHFASQQIMCPHCKLRIIDVIQELVEVQAICWRDKFCSHVFYAKLTKTLEIVSTVSASPTSSPNAVPWWNFPAHAPALLPKSSIILPTVIRDGNPWGFIIKSGQTPLSLKGMSSCRTILPTTPFCPCLLLNLSPSSGRLVCLIRTYNSEQSQFKKTQSMLCQCDNSISKKQLQKLKSLMWRSFA